MEELLEEIRLAIGHKLYYLALFATITIPDICSALESEDYKTSGREYRKWFDQYIAKINPHKYGINGTLTSNHLYKIRCSLLHQGMSGDKTDYARMLFLEPGTPGYESLQSIHCCIVGNKTENQSLLVNIIEFCNDMSIGAKEWLKDNKNSEIYKRNYNNMIRRHPNGISPVFGTSVIG